MSKLAKEFRKITVTKATSDGSLNLSFSFNFINDKQCEVIQPTSASHDAKNTAKKKKKKKPKDAVLDATSISVQANNSTEIAKSSIEETTKDINVSLNIYI